MSQSSEKVKTWRKRTKSRIIEAMGGKCVCCGYDKCHRALDLHHLDREEKHFGFSQIRANARKWIVIVDELRKCVLVCNRCHAEIHDGLIQVPLDAARFDESFAEYRIKEPLEICPICGEKTKAKYNKTCSRSCAAKKSRKVDWDQIDLYKLIFQEKYSYTRVADILGVSDTAVKKKVKKLYLDRSDV